MKGEKMRHNLIFGHKTPDTDSVCAAIALAELKNELNEASKPYILGNVNKETEFVLKYFNVETPQILSNVKLQIKDLNYDRVKPIRKTQPVYSAYIRMNENSLCTLPVVDEEDNVNGIINKEDIAMSLINADQQHLSTSYDNIIETLHGKKLLKFDETIDGDIIVATSQVKTLEESSAVNRQSIVIVGDRYDVIKYAVEERAKLIIVSGNMELPPSLIELAKDGKVNIISTSFKTYYVAKNIVLSKYIKNVINDKKIVMFSQEDYLSDCRGNIEKSQYSVVVSSEKKYLGLLSKSNLNSPHKKKVILVDHNEIGQSADGLDEADILEVIDHHKIGGIKTSVPIAFRNLPLGSSNTIIYGIYKEKGIKIRKEIAGLMLSGIISDTMLFKSPTTTEKDRDAAQELQVIAEVDMNKYAMEMFKAGTSLKGQSMEEILFQDFKDFNLVDKNVGIGQVFTLDINQIMGRKDEFIKLIDSITAQKGYYVIILAVTDIIKEGSYIFCTSGREKLVGQMFGIENVTQGVYIDKCVSRKKQIVPKVIDALGSIK